MPIDLQVLLDDYNGSAMAVAGHAEWGFIPEAWFIAIPRNQKLPDDIAINTSPFATVAEEKRFISANYHKVRQVAGSNEAALFIAMLRLHIARQGVLANLLANRAVVEDEYSLADPQGVDWAAPENDVPDVGSFSDIAKFVKHHGNTFVHQMVYLFSARGHHWDPAYNDLYERLKKACFITGNFGFALPSNEVIYRLAIHGFGVKPLLQLTLDNVAHGNVAAAMALRFNPAPPIAGMAHITTLEATLRTMSQEAWWDIFLAKFTNEIDVIRNETNLVHQNPFTYHVAAKVFGYANRKTASQASLAAFNRLSQFALGYIDHLGRRHSLSGQQAITQKSGGPRGIAEAFSRACDRFGKPNVDVASMADFLATV